jgi:hypothetical protein
MQVRVSYIEIYLEKIKDLLNPAQDNLNVREGGAGPAGMLSPACYLLDAINTKEARRVSE